MGFVRHDILLAQSTDRWDYKESKFDYHATAFLLVLVGCRSRRPGSTPATSKIHHHRVVMKIRSDCFGAKCGIVLNNTSLFFWFISNSTLQTFFSPTSPFTIFLLLNILKPSSQLRVPDLTSFAVQLSPPLLSLPIPSTSKRVLELLLSVARLIRHGGTS